MTPQSRCIVRSIQRTHPATQSTASTRPTIFARAHTILFLGRSPWQGGSSNPLDGVRDLIMREGPGVFDSSNLGRIDDLFREAGSDVYQTVGPILGEVRGALDRRSTNHFRSAVVVWRSHQSCDGVDQCWSSLS